MFAPSTSPAGQACRKAFAEGDSWSAKESCRDLQGLVIHKSTAWSSTGNSPAFQLRVILGVQ